MPPIVANLRRLIQKASFAEERTGCPVCEVSRTIVVIPGINLLTRNLSQRIDQLIRQAKLHLSKQEQKRRNNLTQYSLQVGKSVDTIQGLLKIAFHLADHHRRGHRLTQDAEALNQKLILDELFRLCSHPMLLQQYDSMNPTADQTVDTLTDCVIRTDQFIKAIGSDLQAVLDGHAKLLSWMENPRTCPESRTVEDARTSFIRLIDEHSKTTKGALASRDLYVANRATLALSAIQDPLNFQNLCAFASLESESVDRWINHASSTADQCTDILNFVVRNVKLLEPNHVIEGTAVANAIRALY